MLLMVCRRARNFMIPFFSRIWLYTLGFLHIPFYGKMASHKEASAYVVAPHSSFMDGLVPLIFPYPFCAVTRYENGQVPLLGGKHHVCYMTVHVCITCSQLPQATAAAPCVSLVAVGILCVPIHRCTACISCLYAATASQPHQYAVDMAAASQPHQCTAHMAAAIQPDRCTVHVCTPRCPRVCHHC